MVFIAKKLKEIMSIDNKEERQKQLKELARKVGAGTTYYAPGIPSDAHPPEAELVARIQDARRTNSIVHSSIAAIVSAVIALLSAIAAWLAVVYN
jgi:hypothetical protein